MNHVQVALTMAERAVDEAGRAYDAAIDHSQQTLERYGEDSEQYRQSDAFCATAYDLVEVTKQAAQLLEKAKPTGSPVQ